MSGEMVERDERAVAVENASYRWAYLVLSFGLLAAVAARSLLLGDPSWDLLALVILGGAVSAAYQGWHRTLGPRWLFAGLGAVLLAAVVAVVLVAARLGR